MAVSGTFTQADINLGDVTYDHDGSETNGDSFDFSLADGGEDGATPVAGTFNFTSGGAVSLLTINGLTAASEVLIPIQCEYYALEGVSQLVSNIQLVRQNINPQLKVEGVVLTMFDGRVVGRCCCAGSSTLRRRYISNHHPKNRTAKRSALIWRAD